MKTLCLRRYGAGILLGFSLCLGLLQAPSGFAQPQETFSELQVGTQTYRNVTVTDKSKKSIFIVHSQGMTSIRVADLPPEIRTKLGYVEEKPQPTPPTPMALARQTLAKLEVPQVRNVEEQLRQKWNPDRTAEVEKWFRSLTPGMKAAGAGVVLILYLFYCNCCRLICKKAGKPSSVLVWFPILKIFPLLTAAGMSGWWFLALFVPILNLVTSILWCFKIAQARGKGVVTAILLILPVFNIFAFLYLALSNSGVAKKQARPAQVMTLETA